MKKLFVIAALTATAWGETHTAPPQWKLISDDAGATTHLDRANLWDVHDSCDSRQHALGKSVYKGFMLKLFEADGNTNLVGMMMDGKRKCAKTKGEAERRKLDVATIGLGIIMSFRSW